MMDVKAGSFSFRPSQIFWTIVLLLATVTAVAGLSTYRLIEQYSATARSQQALLELDRLLSDLKDVEIGARSYALTGDRRFLEPYRRGISNLERSFGRLRTLARTELPLANGLDEIEGAAGRRVALASQLINATPPSTNNARLTTTALAGKQAMDETRSAVAAALSAQEQTYVVRRQSVEQQAVIATTALGIGVALSLAILVWLFRRLDSEIARRRRVEDELRALNNELEERVQERTAELDESRKLLDAVIQNIPDTIFLKDATDDFKYVMVNEAGEKLIGRSRSELIGRVDQELFPGVEATLCRNEDQKVAETSSLRLVSERRVTTSNGQRVVETRKVPLELDEGAKKFVLGVARDLTEQKALETQVRQMQRLESVGRLTGGVAHDFNNLLAVILGSVDLLREKLPDGSDAAELADEALDAVRRGADLVRRLLAFARKQHLEPIAVDLNERLPDVVPLLQRTLGENIRVQVKPSGSLWLARIDPTQVDDALVNMAINARDAMPGGGKLTIETANVVLDEDYAAHHAEVDAGEYVMLAVSDTGSGMPPDVVARAFEPFFTTKAEGKGTGLGLSQVFGWVKQSGGHIKIYSEVNHGTTVKLYLPRATAADSRGHEPQPHELQVGGDETILVVEDNPNVRRTVKRQLIDLGYAVIEAENADAALAAIRSSANIDLMLSDVVMPGGLSGYELAAEAENLRPGLKVIFTSGYTELAATGLQHARSGPLISKPYTKRDLGRAIRSALENGGTTSN